MCGRPPRSVRFRGTLGRAIIGVIALYALLLQAFLGSAAPAAAFDPAGGVLCADHAGGAPGDDGADGKARAACRPCCTVAHAQALGAPPPAGAAVPWPRPAPARAAWRPEAAAPKTGPPVHAASARGPPAA